MLAEYLGVHPDRLVFTMTDISGDAPFAQTLFHVELDGNDKLPPEIDRKVKEFVRTKLGMGTLGHLDDVPSV